MADPKAAPIDRHENDMDGAAPSEVADTGLKDVVGGTTDGEHSLYVPDFSSGDWPADLHAAPGHFPEPPHDPSHVATQLAGNIKEGSFPWVIN